MAFRKADLLLPLCLVSAILLNVYAAVDPTGVYQRYLEKLAPMTPPVAAMATALGSPEEQPNSAPMDATPARLGSGFINQYLLSSPWTSAHPFEAQAFSASPQRCHPRWWPASARRR